MARQIIVGSAFTLLLLGGCASYSSFTVPGVVPGDVITIYDIRELSPETLDERLKGQAKMEYDIQSKLVQDTPKCQADFQHFKKSGYFNLVPYGDRPLLEEQVNAWPDKTIGAQQVDNKMRVSDCSDYLIQEQVDLVRRRMANNFLNGDQVKFVAYNYNVKNVPGQVDSNSRSNKVLCISPKVRATLANYWVLADDQGFSHLWFMIPKEDTSNPSIPAYDRTGIRFVVHKYPRPLENEEIAKRAVCGRIFKKY